MKDYGWSIPVCIFVALVTWAAAHETVASECRKLGGFYVGSAVYECKIKR